ncbi:MAG: DUF362 domain-containing protein [Treponema sp.]|nr:DUF362 domain-containing protein [Treponema sp.]
MKKSHIFNYIFAAVLCVFVLCSAGCFQKAQAQSRPRTQPQPAAPVQEQVKIDEASVFMTTSITPAGLMAVYRALGREANGKVAVKISTGEPGNKHFLSPELIKNLVQHVNGTIVECNTVYGGRRASTAAHYQVAKEHGFTAIAPVVIMDEKEEISIPVTGGKHLKEDIVGARFKEFDFHVVLSHFKGHQMGGLGGALKNMSIGYASSAGKAWIHSGGKSKTRPWGGAQNDFLESMAEAAKAISDANRNKILYINVMNHLSVDCDCSGKPAAPTMADIGILASLDPVALDQACVDLVYAAADGKDLIERIESRNGLLTIEHAEKIGLGKRQYKLIKLDS